VVSPQPTINKNQIQNQNQLILQKVIEDQVAGQHSLLFLIKSHKASFHRSAMKNPTTNVFPIGKKTFAPKADCSLEVATKTACF